VENGSIDRTAEVVDVSRRVRPHPARTCPAWQGRRLANGMLAAMGKWLVLLRCGFFMPVEYVERLVAALQGGADIAIASREAAGSSLHW